MTVDTGKTGAVLVAGGGIAGMQSALDLAESGFKVYLVDTSPSIGGRMAQLDKTFPSNDCAMCTLAPRIADAGKHPNIEIFAYTDLVSSTGQAGHFEVTVNRRARSINADKCTGCAGCVPVCPVLRSKARAIPSEFDAELTVRGAIYLPFPQAIPRVPVIDRIACLRFHGGQYTACADACEAHAIDFTQEDEVSQISVGAVILTAGCDAIDPAFRSEFGYGQYPNVLSSLQFERLLSASGPSAGAATRRSDGKPPRSVAFIQCIGTREIERNYCSSVCCMQATKEAIMLKEHAPDTACTIFFVDLRAFGKGYQAFFDRAKALGVQYVRSRPASIAEISQSRNPALHFETAGGSMASEEFDLVVLGMGMEPSAGARRLLDVFGVEVDDLGFARAHEMSPVETSMPGVFVAGAISGPKDIPESVVEASAAACKASSLLSESRGTLVKEKSHPEEKSVTGQEPRIGVIVCQCGRNIDGVVNVPAVVEHSKSLPDVVHAEQSLYACSTEAQLRIQKMINEHNLNRLVVAACTPRTHEPLFRETVRGAGLNPYLLEMANIRDQCSWVHAQEPERATYKAKDLVRMGVAKARLLEPLPASEVAVTPTALILGGGLAGMTAAWELAQQGYEAFLLEKTNQLGGNFRRVKYLMNGVDPAERLASLERDISNHPLIHIFTKVDLLDFGGSAGNFRTKFQSYGQTYEMAHGVTIVATGGTEHVHPGYLHGSLPEVITQLELEQMLKDGSFRARSVTMIQCAGSCEQPESYCSRLCCAQAVKTALRIKDTSPGTSVLIIHRDMRTYGFYEAKYREAREKGVRFLRLAEGSSPRVSPAGTSVRVSVQEGVLNARLDIDSDLLVLSTGIAPGPDNEFLASTLKVPLTQDGFFLEAQMKLRPVDCATDGIFLCGLAHSPKTADESVAQARAAVARAVTILSKPRIQLETAVAEVVDEKCDGCAYCVEVCPYQAIKLVEYTRNGAIKKTVDLDPARCRGCGLCQATCPKDGIVVRNFRLDQLSAMVDAALEGWRG